MKKLFLLLLVLSITGFAMVANAAQGRTVKLQIGNPYATVDGVQKLIDPDNKNVVPIIQNDRTMLPIRFIGENFGLEVSNIFSDAFLDRDDLSIWIAAGETVARVWTPELQYGSGWKEVWAADGVQMKSYTKVPLDSPAVIIEDRMFLPVRFVSETMGLNVEWNNATKEVTITEK